MLLCMSIDLIWSQLGQEAGIIYQLPKPMFRSLSWVTCPATTMSSEEGEPKVHLLHHWQTHHDQKASVGFFRCCFACQVLCTPMKWPNWILTWTRTMDHIPKLMFWSLSWFLQNKKLQITTPANCGHGLHDSQCDFFAIQRSFWPPFPNRAEVTHQFDFCHFAIWS